MFILIKLTFEALQDESIQRGCVTSTEAKHGHLPVTPLHVGLQNIKGEVDGFTELIRETMIN